MRENPCRPPGRWRVGARLDRRRQVAVLARDGVLPVSRGPTWQRAPGGLAQGAPPHAPASSMRQRTPRPPPSRATVRPLALSVPYGSRLHSVGYQTSPESWRRSAQGPALGEGLGFSGHGALRPPSYCSKVSKLLGSQSVAGCTGSGVTTKLRSARGHAAIGLRCHRRTVEPSEGAAARVYLAARAVASLYGAGALWQGVACVHQRNTPGASVAGAVALLALAPDRGRAQTAEE